MPTIRILCRLLALNLRPREIQELPTWDFGPLLIVRRHVADITWLLPLSTWSFCFLTFFVFFFVAEIRIEELRSLHNLQNSVDQNHGVGRSYIGSIFLKNVFSEHNKKIGRMNRLVASKSI